MSKMIKILITDIDGTLTDGKIHIGQAGELFKSFDVKDGYGIANILPKHGILPVVVTGRSSEIVKYRCSELGIIHLYQGVSDKKKCLEEISESLNIPFSQFACIGDDENDLPMFEVCAVKGCPFDAVDKVKEKADFVSSKNGGEGAVREFIEFLIKNIS